MLNYVISFAFGSNLAFSFAHGDWYAAAGWLCALLSHIAMLVNNINRG